MKGVPFLTTLSLFLVASYSVLASEPPVVSQTKIGQPIIFDEQQQLEEYYKQKNAQIHQFNNNIQSYLEQSYENKMKWGDNLNEIRQQQLRMERDRINRPPQLPNRFFR